MKVIRCANASGLPLDSRATLPLACCSCTTTAICHITIASVMSPDMIDSRMGVSARAATAGPAAHPIRSLRAPLAPLCWPSAPAYGPYIPCTCRNEGCPWIAVAARQEQCSALSWHSCRASYLELELDTGLQRGPIAATAVAGRVWRRQAVRQAAGAVDVDDQGGLQMYARKPLSRVINTRKAVAPSNSNNRVLSA